MECPNKAVFFFSLCDELLKRDQHFNARKFSANKNPLLQHRCLVSSFVPVLAIKLFECFLFLNIFLRRSCSDVCGKPTSSLPLLRCDTLHLFVHVGIVMSYIPESFLSFS